MVNYVDDTTEHDVCQCNSSGKMQQVANNTSQWSHDNKMTVKYTKTKDIVINFSQEHLNIPNLILKGEVIELHQNCSRIAYLRSPNMRYAHQNN